MIARRGRHYNLHDWDGIADCVNEDIIPVDVLHYLIDWRGRQLADATVLAILLDYYFVHLLALLSVRIWTRRCGTRISIALPRSWQRCKCRRAADRRSWPTPKR